MRLKNKNSSTQPPRITSIKSSRRFANTIKVKNKKRVENQNFESIKGQKSPGPDYCEANKGEFDGETLPIVPKRRNPGRIPLDSVYFKQ
ncbi:hypothetical protein AYI70_g7343 [Smittium culicis]|uniref:Uncharacterized protein n=1 Tax=Smittium culicis TaxID=133412 RepID=A0A1R1XL13_9FUNG|nr:hypothetical protein AYI70_g7343 [Smittium culicis]